MASDGLESGETRTRWGYVAAIAGSALGHILLIVLGVLVISRFFQKRFTPPPSYSVKIVDAKEAGDLGTHLPRLSHAEPAAPLPRAEPPKPPAEEPKAQPPPPPPPEPDENAIALNTTRTPKVTPTPRPTLAPTPTAHPTPAPTPRQKKATPAPTPHRKKATPTPTSKAEKKSKQSPKAKPTIVVAKVAPTPSVRKRLDEIRRELLAEHLKARRKAQEEDEEDDANEEEAPENGGGPVAARSALAGEGFGVGAGTGSAGIQNDLDFLLYYRTVQERIKKAWSYAGGDANLETTVTFAIGPDGGLAGVKISHSSRDAAYDDSVVRAIRRAAPFPAPPEKYRGQFAQGIEALFKLGELNS